MKPKTYIRLLCSALLSGWIAGCATLPSERAITITPVSLLTPDTLSRIHVDATLHIPSKALSNRSRLIVRPRLLQGNSPISEYPVMAFDAPITLNRLDIYDMASADGLSYAFNTTLARNRALAAKEGLVGPLVDGVVDDAVLYGRLINIKNPLAYTSSPNVAYNTHYAFLNLTLDDYGTSDASDPVTVEAGRYEPSEFTGIARSLERVPEGGERCFRCYELRLRETAQIAKERGFDWFCTTLSISPLKNAQKLNEIGLRLAAETGVRWLPSDFKKKEGFKRSIVLSEEYSLYRQNYCGCVYSKALAGESV